MSFINSWVISHCSYRPQLDPFFHPCHLDYFQIMIVNSTALNIGVHLYFQIYISVLGGMHARWRNRKANLICYFGVYFRGMEAEFELYWIGLIVEVSIIQEELISVMASQNMFYGTNTLFFNFQNFLFISIFYIDFLLSHLAHFKRFKKNFNVKFFKSIENSIPLTAQISTCYICSGSLLKTKIISWFAKKKKRLERIAIWTQILQVGGSFLNILLGVNAPKSVHLNLYLRMSLHLWEPR